MKWFALLTLLFSPTLLVTAQNLKSRESAARDALKRDRPEIDWTRSTSLQGDFDYDGANDFAFGTLTGKTYYVGIVRGSQRGKPKITVLRFAENSSDQASLCR